MPTGVWQRTKAACSKCGLKFSITHMSRHMASAHDNTTEKDRCLCGKKVYDLARHQERCPTRSIEALVAFGDVTVSDNGCWVWNRSTWSNGYGRVGSRRAHRIAFTLVAGDPADLLVCHKCDNALCINPEHLFAGTQLDNIHDMIAKGRKVVVTGEAHPSKRPEFRAAFASHNPMHSEDVIAKVSGDSHWSRRHPERWSQHKSENLTSRRQK